MKKILVSMMIISILLASLSFSVNAWSSSVTLVIDGVSKKANFDAPPITVQNDILCPVWALYDQLGLDVSWAGDTYEMAFNDYLFLQIDSKTARFSDGTTKQMDNAPTIINDRTMVPYKFIAEQFGYNCTFYESLNTITLTSLSPPLVGMDYTINNISMQTPSGGALSAIPTSGDFRVTVNLTKNSNTGDGVIIIALYGSNGKLFRVYHDGKYLTPNTILPKTPTNISVLASQMPGYTIAKIKVFIWRDMGGVEPLAKAGNYPAQ
jgi:hypothetical protein